MAAKVTSKTALNAVSALLKWRKSKSDTQKADLLDSDELLYLVVSLKKIPPKGRVNAYKLPLPTPLHSNLTEFCLIYDDRPKSKLTKPQIQAKIKADNLPIVKILKYTKLKSDYKAFESKRKLLNSYDMFLADKQIVPLLPRLLGKQFFKKKRIPVPVDLLKKNWKEQVDRVCGSALLFLSTGTCSVVRVARTSMSEDEIVENVVEAINGVVGVVEGGWEGVRSLHLKLLESIPLPLYQTLPDVAKEVKEKVMEEVKESKDEKKEKVGKKKGMIREVKNLDSNVVDEEKSGKEKSSPKEGKRKKEKVVDESNVDGGEARKLKRNKEKGVSEPKMSKGQMEKLAMLVDEGSDFDVEMAEKPAKKAVNAKAVKKGEAAKMQLKKLGKAKDDVVLNVEKPLKKAGKANDDVVLNVEKTLKKSSKAKDVVLNVERPLRKTGKEKDDVVLNVEKTLKKAGKAKDDVVLNVERPLRKAGKAKDDVVVNVEKPLKKTGKVKDSASAVVKQKSDELAAKDKKKDITKKKGDELSSKGGESVGKKEKRKSPVKLKSEEAKLKRAKRTK